MSERYADWKARKDEERQRNAVDMGRPMGGARGSGCFKVKLKKKTTNN